MNEHDPPPSPRGVCSGRIVLCTMLVLGVLSLLNTIRCNSEMKKVIDSRSMDLKRWISNTTLPSDKNETLPQLTITQGSTAGTEESRRLTLPEITRSYENYTCPKGLVYVPDTVLPDYASENGSSDRKIPRVIHMTSKSRCVTAAFAKNVEQWRFPNHSFFFHDDDAVDRFINQEFTLFPHFQNIMQCITSAAAKADLWRYLMIWEHGGIYTDFDNAPEKGFQQGNAIQPSDDAWFPLESLGVVAQYFFAASPNHPIMYTSLHWGLMAIWNLDNIQNNKAPYTTGPRATKNGFIEFMKGAGVETNGYIPAGLYVGMNQRSVTVVGHKSAPHEFVNRGGVRKKGGEYEKMGMVHFSKQRSGPKRSCSHHIYLEYAKEMMNGTKMLES